VVVITERVFASVAWMAHTRSDEENGVLAAVTKRRPGC
jgi:hypothetical protein